MIGRKEAVSIGKKETDSTVRLVVWQRLLSLHFDILIWCKSTSMKADNLADVLLLMSLVVFCFDIMVVVEL